jgi:hypothetical protein
MPALSALRRVGTMAVQAASAVAITGGAIANITDLAVVDGGTGASTQEGARANLGLGSMAVQAASAVAITGGAIANITDLAVADGGTGASTPEEARANLGLGSMAVQAASAVAITGGTVQARPVVSSETTGTLTIASRNTTVTLTGGLTLPATVFSEGDCGVCAAGASARTITRGAGLQMFVNGVDVTTATLGAGRMMGWRYRSASIVDLAGVT